ncbi:MAG: hypothetical protein U0359_01770 [Byssovorax sp.]
MSSARSVGLVRGMFAAATGGVTALTLMACYGVAPCDPDACSGSGGSGGGTTTGTTTTTTTSGTGGAGGGTACTPCADAMTKLATDSSTVCADQRDAFSALVTCGCTTLCAADCGDNTCKGGDITAGCQACIDASCVNEKNACLPAK